MTYQGKQIVLRTNSNKLESIENEIKGMITTHQLNYSDYELKRVTINCFHDFLGASICAVQNPNKILYSIIKQTIVTEIQIKNAEMNGAVNYTIVVPEDYDGNDDIKIIFHKNNFIETPTSKLFLELTYKNLFDESASNDCRCDKCGKENYDFSACKNCGKVVCCKCILSDKCLLCDVSNF